jgi:hypothetical protein
MSPERLPPPQPEQCLILSRKSRFRGGTIIAEDVWTLEEHRRRMSSPDGYRPCECARCGHDRLHLHDYLERKPLGVLMLCVLTVARFMCANPSCGATWRVLPAFLARHLWWVWERVERSTPAEPRPTTAELETPVEAAGARPGRPVPDRTRRRWLGRLASSARQLLVLLASTGTAAVKAVAERVHLDATRRMLVEAYVESFAPRAGTQLACIGALVDRLERGIRLM